MDKYQTEKGNEIMEVERKVHYNENNKMINCYFIWYKTNNSVQSTVMLILLHSINTMRGKSLAIEEKNYVEFTTEIYVLRSSSSEPKANG